MYFVQQEIKRIRLWEEGDVEEIPGATDPSRTSGTEGVGFPREAAASKQTHARILLLSDEAQADGGMKDEEIAWALQIGCATVERVRRRCVEEGIEAALARKEQLRRREKRLDGEGEAHLIALACGEPPEGRASWTLQLLAERLVQCEIVESISTETVGQSLKKTNSSPG